MEATFQTLTTSFNKSIKKINILSIKEEQRMLAQAICQPTSHVGLNLKFGYFYMWNFFIKVSKTMILMNLVRFHYLLVLLQGFIKVF
jgi:hypothetical protein